MDISLGGLKVLPSRSGNRLEQSNGMEGPLFSADTGRILPPKLQVLLVEDQLGDAHLVKYALRNCRQPLFAVHHVSTLGQAIAALRSEPPFDVILLDLSLPDSSGLSTVSRVQAEASRVPIVVMTGLEDPHFADQALEAGAQDYLVKSDDPEQAVVRAIRYAITRMKARIERDALAERLAEQQKILMNELAAARSVQFDLLPRPEAFSPRFQELHLQIEAAFEPSPGIGGDLWGCMDLGEQQVALYSFDFSGHGIGAALNVFRLQTLIAAHWHARQRPAELLHILSEELRRLLERGQFATMFFCILDVAAGALEWSAAGAPRPLYLYGEEMRFLDTGGLPLGLNLTPSYTNCRMTFPVGASLILYSDAITEAQDRDGTVLGEEGLLALAQDIRRQGETVTIERLIDLCFAKVQTPLSDDLTAVRLTRLLG